MQALGERRGGLDHGKDRIAASILPSLRQSQASHHVAVPYYGGAGVGSN
jgi:hypothetical protein